MRRKNFLNKKIILISALIGLVLSLPLWGGLYYIEKEKCGYAIHKEQTDVKGIPLCNKLSEERIKEVWHGYCVGETLYDFEKKEPCMRKFVFFPFFPMIDYMHPDAGLFVVWLIWLYGTIVGGLIGGLINLTVISIKNKIK